MIITPRDPDYVWIKRAVLRLANHAPFFKRMQDSFAKDFVESLNKQAPLPKKQQLQLIRLGQVLYNHLFLIEELEKPFVQTSIFKLLSDKGYRPDEALADAFKKLLLKFIAQLHPDPRGFSDVEYLSSLVKFYLEFLQKTSRPQEVVKKEEERSPEEIPLYDIAISLLNQYRKNKRPFKLYVSYKGVQITQEAHVIHAYNNEIHLRLKPIIVSAIDLSREFVILPGRYNQRSLSITCADLRLSPLENDAIIITVNSVYELDYVPTRRSAMRIEPCTPLKAHVIYDDLEIPCHVVNISVEGICLQPLKKHRLPENIRLIVRLDISLPDERPVTYDIPALLLYLTESEKNLHYHLQIHPKIFQENTISGYIRHCETVVLSYLKRYYEQRTLTKNDMAS